MNEKDAIYKFVELESEIQKRYKPLDWLDITLWVEEGKGSITFGNNAKRQSELAFFKECRQIKEFIQSKRKRARRYRTGTDIWLTIISAVTIIISKNKRNVPRTTNRIYAELLGI